MNENNQGGGNKKRSSFAEAFYGSGADGDAQAFYGGGDDEQDYAHLLQPNGNNAPPINNQLYAPNFNYEMENPIMD